MALLTTERPARKTILSPASTRVVSQTGVSGAALVVTLPLEAGYRHYIAKIHITRSATVLLSVSATPTVVTTANLPGALSYTFGSDAAPIGNDKSINDNFSPLMPATETATDTVITCPATTGVIWRCTVVYTVGLL